MVGVANTVVAGEAIVTPETAVTERRITAIEVRVQTLTSSVRRVDITEAWFQRLGQLQVTERRWPIKVHAAIQIGCRSIGIRALCLVQITTDILVSVSLLQITEAVVNRTPLHTWFKEGVAVLKAVADASLGIESTTGGIGDAVGCTFAPNALVDVMFFVNTILTFVLPISLTLEVGVRQYIVETKAGRFAPLAVQGQIHRFIVGIIRILRHILQMLGTDV